jgi:hypothetical protein
MQFSTKNEEEEEEESIEIVKQVYRTLLGAMTLFCIGYVHL